MKLYLAGHDYKYAAEQIMMAILPGAKPEYTDDEPSVGEDFACVTLTVSDGKATATTNLRYNGAEASGEAETNAGFSNDIAKNRELQKIIKLSFYNAAIKVLSEKPAWGALTGIRPGAMVTKMLAKGMSDDEAVREMQDQYFVDEARARLCLDTAKAALDVKSRLDKRDIALYVGIPFCPTRCAYCSFVSASVEKSFALIEPFLDTLKYEIETTAAAVRELELNPVAVYIGGGTPTTLTAAQLTKVLDLLYGEFDLKNVREFCVEAGRPDTITEDKLRAMSGRVSRISINPQSMSDEVLAAIGRKHSAQSIRDTYRMARETLDADINMDLIAGLPADTPDGFYGTVQEILSMAPENITIHTLALKRGTQITMEDTSRPDKSAVRQMLDMSTAALRGCGYHPYYLYRQKFMSGGFENVGWGMENKDSLYNILIMEELCSIIAMGGGGSTKLVNSSKGQIERIFDAKYPKEYIESRDKILSDKDKMIRFYNDMRGD